MAGQRLASSAARRQSDLPLCTSGALLRFMCSRQQTLHRPCRKQEGQPNRFCYGNQRALDLFECT